MYWKQNYLFFVVFAFSTLRTNYFNNKTCTIKMYAVAYTSNPWSCKMQTPTAYTVSKENNFNL